jgi:hypothetical protein
VVSSDEDEGLANLFQTLERRSYKTYSARLQASRRLASRNRAWNASLIATSTATTIASVALLTDSSIYGRSGPTLLVCTAILTLIASLVASGLDYSGRSRDMFLNYRRLQRLSAEVERYVCSAGLQSREVLETLHERYDGLLDESENHLNSRIQAIRVPARGYRNREHFKTAIYFHCGGLQLYPQTHGLPG